MGMHNLVGTICKLLIVVLTHQQLGLMFFKFVH